MYDITSSICETFCPLYLWYHNHYVWKHKPVSWLHHTRHMYDIIWTKEDVTFTLSHQATIFLTSHPLQAWHHTPCIRDRTNCIFVITTSPLISHPLFLWHHTRPRYSIFCTIEDITSSLYEIKPPFLWYHTHDVLHRIDVISVTTSTVLIPHQMYLWDLILYMWWHHIHCIQQHIHYICTITDTLPVSPTHSFHDITPFIYMTLHPLCLTSNTLYKVSLSQFMSSRHIILTPYALYSCHHFHNI